MFWEAHAYIIAFMANASCNLWINMKVGDIMVIWHTQGTDQYADQISIFQVGLGGREGMWTDM